MAIAVRAAGDVNAVGEECAEEVGFSMQVRIDECGDQDFGYRRRVFGKEGWKFDDQRVGG